MEELLRFVSPVQFVAATGRARGCRRSAAYLIRKGEGVFALLPAANRDERAFADPDRFDFARDASHHLAFGYGIHQCLGQMLARIRAADRVCSPAAPALPACGSPCDWRQIRFKHDMQIYGVHNLPVTW